MGGHTQLVTQLSVVSSGVLPSLYLAGIVVLFLDRVPALLHMRVVRECMLSNKVSTFDL